MAAVKLGAHTNLHTLQHQSGACVQSARAPRRASESGTNGHNSCSRQGRAGMATGRRLKLLALTLALTAARLADAAPKPAAR